MGKGEIARDERFLPFPQSFLPACRNFCHCHQGWKCRLQTLSVWKSPKFVVLKRVNASDLLLRVHNNIGLAHETVIEHWVMSLKGWIFSAFSLFPIMYVYSLALFFQDLKSSNCLIKGYQNTLASIGLSWNPVLLVCHRNTAADSLTNWDNLHLGTDVNHKNLVYTSLSSYLWCQSFSVSPAP